MVLWEITLATAYFLGLRRTYRLALKIQRRLISHKHPKIRQFAHRRTRAVFDVVLNVHRRIQQRDIEVGRNLGNWILRWLDRMKPSAQIRISSSGKSPTNHGATTSVPKTTHQNANSVQGSTSRSFDRESGRHSFITSTNIWPKAFPTIGMIMRPPKPTGTNTHYRHLSIIGPNYGRGRFEFEGVIRKDIMQWMLQKWWLQLPSFYLSLLWSCQSFSIFCVLFLYILSVSLLQEFVGTFGCFRW